MRKYLNKGARKKKSEANSQTTDLSPPGSHYIRAEWCKPSDEKLRMLAKVIAKTLKD